jgi:tRNA-dihydrouridine synthase
MHDRRSLRTRHARHRHVEHYRCDAFMVGAEAINGLDAIRGEQHFEAGSAERASAETQYGFFVIDEQHARRRRCFGLILGGRAALNSVRRGSGHPVFLSYI